ncbi:hypothetical protein CPB84DRAFT_1795195, partial [Gymnopilus junonius]
MSFIPRPQNTSHPIRPVIAHGLVGNALENDVPITRPIAIALVISGVMFLMFLVFFLRARFSKKGVVQAKAPPILDLEENSLKSDGHAELLQLEFLKSCFDTYPRRSGLSSPRLGSSDPGSDTPTSMPRFCFSSHNGSPQGNITLPPPAYSSRAHSLASRKPPSISFLEQEKKSKSLLSPPPPPISHPIPLPEPLLPGPPIEHEYAHNPMTYLIPELTPMSPLQVHVSVSDVVSHNTSTCRCTCHGPPYACLSCRSSRPRPISMSPPSAGSFLKCPKEGSSDASSSTGHRSAGIL